MKKNGMIVIIYYLDFGRVCLSGSKAHFKQTK